MTTIHMETEDVRSVAHTIDLAVGDLYFKPGQLTGAANSLTGNWEGGRATYFTGELKRLAKQLEGAVIGLQKLVKDVRYEVDEWEGVATSFGPAIGVPNGVVIAPGVGPEQPKDSGVDYGVVQRIVDFGDIGKEILVKGSRTYLPPYDGNPLINLPSWVGGALGAALTIVDVGLIGVRIYDDMQRYSNAQERRAAVVVDLLFEGLIKALTTVASGAGAEMVRDGLAAALTGVFVGPALLTAALGGTLWLGSQVGAGLLKDWFYSPSVHDAIVKAVAQKMPNP